MNFAAHINHTVNHTSYKQIFRKIFPMNGAINCPLNSISTQIIKIHFQLEINFLIEVVPKLTVEFAQRGFTLTQMVFDHSIDTHDHAYTVICIQMKGYVRDV